MPVPEQTPVNSSVGNGVTTVFPYTFKVFDADDILVEIDGVVVSDSEYSVSGVGVDGGGNVTFSSAPANGAIVTRYRDMAIERQAIDYQEGGGFEAETVDEDVDRAVMIEQQIALAVRRAVKAPRSVSGDQVLSEVDWAARANSVIGFDADGNLTIYAGSSEVTESGNVTFLPDYDNAVAQTVDGVLQRRANILNWIPPELHASIRARTSVADLSTYIANALTDLSDGDSLEWADGDYLFKEVTTAKQIHHFAAGRGLRATSISTPGVVWKMSGNGTHLYKFSNLQTDPALIKHTLVFRGIAHNTNGMTISDAALVIEGIAHVFLNGSISGGGIGAGLRLRLVWAPHFDDFQIYNLDASGANGALIIDDRYNSNNLLNVNYVSFAGLKMEGLLGTYVFVHETSNLDVLDAAGGQFEFGRSSIPSGGPWSVFKIRNGNRVNLHRGVFTNFKNSNKYDKLFEMGYANGGTDYACTFSIKNNFYSGVDASTVELAAAGNARGECFDNYCFNSSNVVPTASIASKAPIRYESPRNLDTGTPIYGADSLKRNHPIMGRASAAGLHFISVHDLYPPINTSTGPYFVTDAAAKNMQGAALESTTAADVILFQLPQHMLAGMPGAGLRLGVRCRSETGVGTIKLQVASLTSSALVVPTTYRTLWFDFSESWLRTMGDSGSDRLRLTTGAGNTEKVYIDGIYIMPLIGPSFEKVRDFDDFLGDVIADQWGTAVGSDPQCVAAAVLASVNGGYVRLTTGDDAGGTMALNGSQLHRFLQWRADSHGLVCEFRVRISAITDVAVFVGLTDTLSLEMPFTLGGSDALTSNATDGCGVLFDTGADTDNWWLVGVDSDSDAAKQNTALAPVAATFETWRIELSNAGVATFLRNGSPIGTTMAAATSPDVRLTPVIAAFSRGAASRNVDVDYVLVEANR